MREPADGAKPSLLVLWDIDHTLIKTGGVGRELFAAAFEKATGVPMRHMDAPAGRTEAVIFRETATQHGVNDPDKLFPLFAKALTDEHERRIDDLRQRGRALPGAEHALTVIASQPHIAQGVLTGNVHGAAVVKLRAFGLEPLVDLTISAFAEDGETRPELIKAARDRAAQRYGTTFDGVSTVLIGDTPNDVQGAHATHAASIAVASGKFTADQLRDAGASTVVADLTDPVALRFLLNEAPSASTNHDGWPDHL